MPESWWWWSTKYDKGFRQVTHRGLINMIKYYWMTDPILLWSMLDISSCNQLVQVNGSSPPPSQQPVAHPKAVHKDSCCLFCTQIFLSTFSKTMFSLFADYIKIVQLSAWGPELYYCQNNRSLNASQHFGQRINAEVLSRNSCILCYKCTFSTRRLWVRCQMIPIKNNVLDLGLNYSCSSKASEHVFAQVAKASRRVGLPHKIIQLN